MIFFSQVTLNNVEVCSENISTLKKNLEVSDFLSSKIIWFLPANHQKHALCHLLTLMPSQTNRSLISFMYHVTCLVFCLVWVSCYCFEVFCSSAPVSCSSHYSLIICTCVYYPLCIQALVFPVFIFRTFSSIVACHSVTFLMFRCFLVTLSLKVLSAFRSCSPLSHVTPWNTKRDILKTFPCNYS